MVHNAKMEMFYLHCSMSTSHQVLKVGYLRRLVQLGSFNVSLNTSCGRCPPHWTTRLQLTRRLWEKTFQQVWTSLLHVQITSQTDTCSNTVNTSLTGLTPRLGHTDCSAREGLWPRKHLHRSKQGSTKLGPTLLEVKTEINHVFFPGGVKHPSWCLGMRTNHPSLEN